MELGEHPWMAIGKAVAYDRDRSVSRLGSVETERYRDRKL